jgi:hypothetical protein
MNVTFIVGWIFLIASWVVPLFIKEKKDKHFTGIALSAIATGIFLGHLLESYFG